MQLDLREVFAGGKPLSVDCELTYEPYEDFSGIDNPVSNLRFRGTVSNKADIVSIMGMAVFDYTAPCDRCAEITKRHFAFDIHHVIVNELSDEQSADEDIIVTDNMQLDLDEVIRTDIVLNLPVKFLCKPDCKGVCVGCGKRLNFEECICQKEVDPRLAKLSEFFDDDSDK